MNETTTTTEELPKGLGIFMGDREVKEEQPVDEGEFINLLFTDGTEFLIHSELYGIIKEDKPINETLDDIIAGTVAKMFLNQLVKYDLRAMQAEAISMFLNNYAHNAYLDATTKLWGGKDKAQVTLGKVMQVLKPQE